MPLQPVPTHELNERLLLTYPEVARRLAVSVRTVQRMVKAGELPALRLGRRNVRISVAALTRVV